MSKFADLLERGRVIYGLQQLVGGTGIVPPEDHAKLFLDAIRLIADKQPDMNLATADGRDLDAYAGAVLRNGVSDAALRAFLQSIQAASATPLQGSLCDMCYGIGRVPARSLLNPSDCPLVCMACNGTGDGYER